MRVFACTSTEPLASLFGERYQRAFHSRTVPRGNSRSAQLVTVFQRCVLNIFRTHLARCAPASVRGLLGKCEISQISLHSSTHAARFVYVCVFCLAFILSEIFKWCEGEAGRSVSAPVLPRAPVTYAGLLKIKKRKERKTRPFVFPSLVNKERFPLLWLLSSQCARSPVHALSCCLLRECSRGKRILETALSSSS